jgi:hypothetical protein
MKHVSKLKLNAKGFAHVELVMIVVTIAVIGGIGSYVMLKKSHANQLPGGSDPTWHTVSSTGTISHVIKNGYTDYFLAYTMPRNSTARVCVTGKSNTSYTAHVEGYFANGGAGFLTSFGTTSKRVCGGSNAFSSSFTASVKVHTTNTSFLVQKVDIQRLY